MGYTWLAWTVLELPYFIHHGLGDVGDKHGRNLHSLELLDLSLNIAGRHATGIQSKDLVFEPIQSGLVLGNEGWLKAGFTITWDGNGDLAL
jgi:hypothetical protein